MQELISRLKAATGPDRELDLAMLNVGAPKPWVWHDRGRETVTRNEYGEGAVGNPVCSLERFTESFEEAISLLPDGMVIIDLTLSWDTCKERGHPAATIRWYPPKTPDPKGWHARVVTAKTIPLTACLAALEARAAIAAVHG